MKNYYHIDDIITLLESVSTDHLSNDGREQAKTDVSCKLNEICAEREEEEDVIKWNDYEHAGCTYVPCRKCYLD